ncbi:hypothetical protein PG989_015246 [Apiospora arundinis]
MSSSPEEAGTAAAQGAPGSPDTEAIEAIAPIKTCMATFTKAVNEKNEKKKKEDNKLAGSVEEVKKEGSAIVEKLIKEQPEPDPTKFLKDFYKAFDPKKVPEARKQLKNKGVQDLRKLMGGIVHATFFDQVVLPELAKKERPSSGVFLDAFRENFDKELDIILKKKEFKIYKDAAAEFGGAQIQTNLVTKTRLDALEKSKDNKELQDQVASLTKDNQRLQHDVDRLTKDKKDEKEAFEYEKNGLNDKLKILIQESEDDYNTIGELEQEREQLQEQLATEKAKSSGQGSMEKKVKDLEKKLADQEDRWEAEHHAALEAEGKVAALQKQLQGALESLDSANDGWSKASQDYETLRLQQGRGGIEGDAEAQKTIEDLRDQVKKREKEFSDLKNARDESVRKLTTELNESKFETQEEKNRYTSLFDDLAAAKKEVEEHKNAVEEHKKETATLKEKHEELVKRHDDAVRAQDANVGFIHEEQRKRIDDMKRRIDTLMASERGLDILAKEQRKCMTEDEAKLKELAQSETSLKEEVEKLNAQLKEQTEKAKKLADAGKKSDGAGAQQLADLQKKHTMDIGVLQEKLGAAHSASVELNSQLKDLKEKTGGASAQQVADLENRINELKTGIEHYKAVHEIDTAQVKELNAAHANDAAQIKELSDQNAKLLESIKKAPTKGGNGGLDTLAEEPEEEEEGDMTPEQRAAQYHKDWAEATATLNERTKELHDAKRELLHLVSSFERSEKRIDDLQVQLGLRDEEHEAATAELQKRLDDALALVAAHEQQVKDALAAAADSEKRLADAVAAAAAGGSAPGNNEAPPGPHTTLGEVTLPPRDPGAAVRGPMRPSRFSGLTDIFGRNRDRGGNGNGNGGAGAGTGATGGPGGNPYAPLHGAGGAGGSVLEDYLFPVFMATLILVICAIFTMGAEGHKASIWYQSNHLTRAQYANDWYYLTIPLPQWEYVFYLFKAMLTNAK